VAAELISDLERIYQRKKAADRELRDLLKATGTTLTSLNGIGPSGAARLLIEAGDITRFPSKAHFASWNGTAPIDASSGDQVRHRLSRAGNRQINRVLHIMAVVQLRHRSSEGRAYYDRKVAAGKTPREAMRSLKRRLSDIVYHQMVLDARTRRAGPGGHMGAAAGSSAAGLHPGAGTSEKSLPGPATSDLTSPSRPDPQAVSRSPSTPDHSCCQAPLCLIAARTGAPSQRGKDAIDTEGGAMSASASATVWVSRSGGREGVVEGLEEEVGVLVLEYQGWPDFEYVSGWAGGAEQDSAFAHRFGDLVGLPRVGSACLVG
jgi:Transposase IS116/IS110/IS902 family